MFSDNKAMQSKNTHRSSAKVLYPQHSICGTHTSFTSSESPTSTIAKLMLGVFNPFSPTFERHNTNYDTNEMDSDSGYSEQGCPLLEIFNVSSYKYMYM